MIQNRFLLVLSLLLLISGAAFFLVLRHNPEPEQVFAATVNRDCAPWDGAAFTVAVPLEEETIKISIYQSPQIGSPVTYRFPDESMRRGNAMLLLSAGIPEPLRGRVSFQGVDQGTAVQGKFDLSTGTGRPFKGLFFAEWGNEIVYCG